MSDIDRIAEKLLPCPFCGGEAAPTAHLTFSWFAPVCKSCGVRGPSVHLERGSEPQKMRELMNKADALWNRRAEKSEAEALRKGAERYPTELFDGNLVFQHLTDYARKRTGPENVSDVLDALKRAIDAAIKEGSNANPL